MYTDYNYSAQDHAMQGRITQFMYQVYGWMSAALAVTAGVAYYVASTPAIIGFIFKNTGIVFGLVLLQFGLVMAISFLLPRISYAAASILFIVYAATLGLTLSSVFLVYTMSSLAITFAVTAGMFGSMCLYGYFTRSDLTRMGALAGMALIGLVLAMLVNMYFKSESADYVISGIGVLLFTALIAFDVQKIKQLAYQLFSTGHDTDKVAVLGALTLYLDFVNLFLFLLRFLGNRRQD